MNTDKNNIFLIDGNSLCYRAYYAIPQLSTSKGEPTNAVYGVVVMIRKIIKEYEPTSMVVAFDLAGETVRHKKYEDYKKNRPPMPDDLSSQMERIKQVIKAYNIPIFEKKGYEADDIMATLTRKSRKKGFDVTIVTGDKDALQLVDDHVKVLSPHPKGDKLYDSDVVIEKFGVPPTSMVDLMALMGDASDNIPGVKGIGKVTARNLVNEYGSLDEVYRQIRNVTPVSIRNKLEEGRDFAQLSRDLVRLQSDVPLEKKNLPERMAEPNNEKINEIFREMEFTKLIREMEPAKKVDIDSRILMSEQELEKLESDIGRAGVFALKVDQEMSGYAVAFPDGQVFYVGFEVGDKFRRKGMDVIKRMVGSSKIIKVGHDLKQDMLLLAKTGIEIKMPYFDVMIADYLVDPSLAGYSLEEISMRRNLAFAGERETSPKRSRDKEMVMDFACPKDVSRVSRMCASAMELYGVLKKELHQTKLEELFWDIEMPLVGVLKSMEEAGVGVDTLMLASGVNKIGSDMKSVSDEAYLLAEEKFNINSPKQIQQILYGKLSLPVGKKIKTGRSTDEETLKKLSTLHELPEKILEYRRLSKLKTTYYDPLLAFTDDKDGILRAKFNQAVTATGRLSSSEPNLQNIPIKTESASEIRRAFRPRKKENIFVAADYSQIELRVLAHLSGDEKLTGAFREGKDVHVFTASLIFGCEIADVTEQMRSTAKTVNFGIIYGMGAFGLARGLGIAQDKAEEFIAAYFDRYVGVKDFISKTIKNTRRDGFVTTLFNRRRYLPEITSTNDRIRSFAERAAVNTAVQGTAADIIKIAMIRCFEHFSAQDVDMVIQVHDELVFDVPGKNAFTAASDIKSIMEGVVDLYVPLEVDVETGPNWKDMEPVVF
jgi:DNA polymerase I